MKQSDITLRTKTNMADSLKRHMKKKNIDKITVREIIEDCQINRQTFYYHFHDIYDLARFMLEQEADHLLHNDTATWYEGLEQLLNYIKENRQFCQCILDSLGRDSLRLFFHADAKELIRRSFPSDKPNIQVSEDFRNFIYGFYLEATVSICINWLRDDMKQSPEQLLQYFQTVMDGNIMAAFTRAQEKGL